MLDELLDGASAFIPTGFILFIIFAAAVVLAFKFFIKFAIFIVPITIVAAIWYFNRDKINKFFDNSKVKTKV